MKIVNSGNTYQIFSDVLETYDELPAGFYSISFTPMGGYSLYEGSELEVNEPKIYGHLEDKVVKVMNGYTHANRNFGVIISGESGMGKSVLMRLIAIKGYENGLPVIMVSKYTPGLVDFLSSIDQRCIVIFDEFEKNFKPTSREDNFDPQEEFLPMFDGIDNGKKLFIITCNETYNLNKYFLNRPGRFHYHFRLSKPSNSEIAEYLEDNITTENKTTQIDEVLGLADFYPFTYDNLRALVYEINLGYSIKESLMDLNIKAEKPTSFSVKILFVDGRVELTHNYSLDWRDLTQDIFLHQTDADGDGFKVVFPTANIKYDRNGKYFYATDKLKLCHEWNNADVDEDTMNAYRLSMPVRVELYKKDNGEVINDFFGVPMRNDAQRSIYSYYD